MVDLLATRFVVWVGICVLICLRVVYCGGLRVFGCCLWRLVYFCGLLALRFWCLLHRFGCCITLVVVLLCDTICVC